MRIEKRIKLTKQEIKTLFSKGLKQKVKHFSFGTKDQSITLFVEVEK